MNKSFSQLKKDLQTGTQLKVIFHAIRPEQVGKIKTISKTQTNGIYTTNPEIFDGRPSWLELPSASLVEYFDNQFIIYDIGKRDLNEVEQQFLKEQKDEWQKRPYDNPYFISLSIARRLGVEYMVSSTPNKRYSNSENKVYDRAIRGEKLFAFEIIKEVA